MLRLSNKVIKQQQMKVMMIGKKSVNNLDKVIAYVKYSRIYKILLELLIYLATLINSKNCTPQYQQKENQIKNNTVYNYRKINIPILKTIL